MLITQPLGSTEARGTFAGLITYSRRRGRNLAGIKSNPKQPRTLPQRAIRVAAAALAKLWAGLTPPEMASWAVDPAVIRAAAYHNFMSYNLLRLTTLPNQHTGLQARDAHPSAAFPATKATQWPLWTGDTITPGSRSAVWRINWTTLNDAWLVIFHHLNAPEPWTILQNIIGVFPITGPGNQYFRLENLPPGNARLAFVPVSRTGLPRDSDWYRDTTINP